MFKVLIYARSSGNVTLTVTEFDNRRMAEMALQQIEDYDSGLPEWTIRGVRLYSKEVNG